MANDPEPEEPNPFKGTPLEHLFAPGGPLSGMAGLGGLAGGAGPAGGMDFNQIISQFKAMMEPHDGPLNWKVVDDLARSSVSQSPDPSPGRRDHDRVADAVQLADHWLDVATEFPSGVISTAAWSRAEWVVETRPVWKVLVEPVAAKSVSGIGNALPQEMQGAAGPLLGIIGQAVGGMLASQIGQGLGGLAGEVLTASDIGLPLGAPGKAALVISNVQDFAEGLDVSVDDVLLYLALREAAHQRLFAHVPWLREHLVGAVTDYAQGLELNVQQMQERIQEQMGSINPMDPASMQGLLEGGLFEPPVSPQQESALSRLEIALALVEGWVDEVVGQATVDRMPAATKLREAVRRRRAAGGPAEQTFAALVGLELRPRRLRDASTLWGGLRTRSGAEARDGVWMHPDLLPTAADLDDPLSFRAEATQPQGLSEDAFDEELRKLLESETPESPEAPEAPTPPAPPTPPTASDSSRRRAGGIARLGRARRCAGSAARPVRRPSRGRGRRHVALVVPRPHHGGSAGDRRRRGAGAAQPPPQGAAMVRVRRACRAGRPDAGGGGRAGGTRGVRDPGPATGAGAGPARRPRRTLLRPARPRVHRPPPRRPLRRDRAAGRAGGRECGVARRALVAGRRPPGARAGNGRPGGDRSLAGLSRAQSASAVTSVPGGGSSRAASDHPRR